MQGAAWLTVFGVRRTASGEPTGAWPCCGTRRSFWPVGCTPAVSQQGTIAATLGVSTPPAGERRCRTGSADDVGPPLLLSKVNTSRGASSRGTKRLPAFRPSSRSETRAIRGPANFLNTAGFDAAAQFRATGSAHTAPLAQPATQRLRPSGTIKHTTPTAASRHLCKAHADESNTTRSNMRLYQFGTNSLVGGWPPPCAGARERRTSSHGGDEAIMGSRRSTSPKWRSRHRLWAMTVIRRRASPTQTCHRRDSSCRRRWHGPPRPCC
jgi:hypothetical protein